MELWGDYDDVGVSFYYSQTLINTGSFKTELKGKKKSFIKETDSSVTRTPYQSL